MQTELTASLPEYDRLAWQARLWELLRIQTERYTMGQSTSLRTETAQAMLRSVCFSLDQLHRAAPGKDFLQEMPDVLLWEAAEEVCRQTARARFQYRRACRCLYQEESIALRDTLRGIGEFFHHYDPRFFAAEVPCDIDYQLAHPVPDNLEGVAWLRDYLDRLLTEDAILRCFHPDAVRRVLSAVCPSHRELLVNLYEPVAEAALGVTMTEENLFGLDITVAGQRKISELLMPLIPSSGRLLLERTGETLARRLELSAGAAAYLRETALALVPRLEAVLSSGGSWQAVFPAFS